MVQICMASVQRIGKLNPGFKGSQMDWIDNDGLILVSNNTNFAFGFITTQDVTLFLLVVIHKDTSTVVWSANRDSPVQNSDSFVFDDSGNAYLQSGGVEVWSSDTANKGVSTLELLDSGNLILRGRDGSLMWQSFSHPTDTLLTNQVFTEGMKLVSSPNSNNLSYSLEIKSGDMILYAGFQTEQPYWAMGKDNRKTINKDGDGIVSATLTANSWRFFDKNKVLLWQFIFSQDTRSNATWVVVLGEDGFITFTLLQGGSSGPSSLRIPQDQCSLPAACDPYFVCYTGNKCQCPPALPSCKLETFPSCNNTKNPVELVNAGDGLSYFALGYVQPFSRTDLNGCRDSCLRNCTCGAMFFESSSGNCFLFDQIGSLQGSNEEGSGFLSYIKVSGTGGSDKNVGGSDKKRFPFVVIIIIVTIFVIFGLLYAGFVFLRKSKKLPESPKEGSDEDNFLEGLSGMPIRFSYNNLQTATVSDFGLAKLMTREQSHVFTTLRGTRGYLAPEWITNYAISEKSDVYSYGMVLLEIIGGRKNYDPAENSEKSHFPSYTFKMMKEGKLKEIIDAKLKIDEEDERVGIAIKVALWCIQDDMYLRPSMTKVVQMLERLSPVPPPPTAPQLGSRLYSSFFKSISEEGTSSGGPSDCNSDAHLSAVRLSGPR
ncbi:unnamed protein product [Fraxinus pennsylvanica]|uniref:Receptor-like serine/threonine-protein kinase n=1 Tax=Fraxinus pennsylvanica TaxID=56036 RepID=A0AAD1ZP84_9LAMI|nr:unnamed protein product [Fraxinus pennsylvanica]